MAGILAEKPTKLAQEVPEAIQGQLWGLVSTEFCPGAGRVQNVEQLERSGRPSARAAMAASWASLTPTRSLGKPPTVSRVKTFPYANGCGKSPFIASNLMVTDSPSEGVDRLA